MFSHHSERSNAVCNRYQDIICYANSCNIVDCESHRDGGSMLECAVIPLRFLYGLVSSISIINRVCHTTSATGRCGPMEIKFPVTAFSYSTYSKSRRQIWSAYSTSEHNTSGSGNACSYYTSHNRTKTHA